VTGRDAFAAAPLERIEGATADLVFAGLLERWIHLAARRIGERRVWLTDLDAAIGDGDHGINLDRGMRELTARLDDGRLVIEPLGAGLEAAGRILMGTVGGASGALYGRGLMWAGRAIIRDGDVPAGAGGAAAADRT